MLLRGQLLLLLDLIVKDRVIMIVNKPVQMFIIKIIDKCFNNPKTAITHNNKHSEVKYTTEQNRC